MKVVNKLKNAFHRKKGHEHHEHISRWKVGTAYNIGEKIRYNGRVYICTTANTATTGAFPNVNTAQWSPVLDSSHQPLISAMHDNIDDDTSSCSSSDSNCTDGQTN